MINTNITHKHMFTIVRVIDSDYTDYGGKIERWKNAHEGYPDCSCGCKWAAWLDGPLGGDWCVCTNPKSPRKGLVTFEHQAGYKCYEFLEEIDTPDV